MLTQIDCPYCGESFITNVEADDGDQDYIEDCQVCCQPIEVHVEVGFDGESVSLSVRRNDD
jgi:transcription elongation factor Elf1